MFTTVGDGLGATDQGVHVDDLFTEKKVVPARSEIKPPDFERSVGKQKVQEPSKHKLRKAHKVGKLL